MNCVQHKKFRRLAFIHGYIIIIGLCSFQNLLKEEFVFVYIT